uniref:Stc1 domain-containing protein n=1 Tax=Ditylum brightwellii TaxID=49249 RepID=A0A6U3ZVH3_9STRA|mmetsp:Transcript_2826/g.4337  ORF Transcript_2826/g.4337 Transcript_2826/m.4337 type:complete len:215 (+) Transcript_2826:46-690(+)
MSTPVVTEKWAGQFDCTGGTCRRKRLVGSEFSKKALERYRKTGGPLKCKQCVAAVEQAERKASAAKAAAATTATSLSSGSEGGKTKTICASCKQSLPSLSSFNKNQLSKGEGKARCRSCVEKSIADEAKASSNSKQEQINDAKERLRVAKGREKPDPKEILAAESQIAALEAEHVTGLKPVKLGRGRGRGGRWGSGSAGRSGRGGRGGRGSGKV